MVSGGCLLNGSVPLIDRIDEIKDLKAMGMFVNVHTGLLDDTSASAIASTGADSFSVDVHSSGHVIRDVLHLGAGKEDYARTLRSLCGKAPGKVSPHICAGLEGDSDVSEKESIDLCAGENIASLVLLKHVKTRGAPHDPKPTMSDATFLGLVSYAVARTKAPVMIGCMRPRPSADLEVRCVELGASGIAAPSSSTKERLEALGYDIVESDLCCAVHL